MLNKTKGLGVGAFALALFLFTGCGRDKALDPFSSFIYDGPYPATVVADVTPAYDRLQYFMAHIELTDPNLSLLPSRDAWTIQGINGTYAIADPGGTILAPLPPLAQTTTAVVSSRSQLRYPVPLLTKAWIDANCAGLIGTTDIATVTLTATMTATRNRDGQPKLVPITFIFTLQDISQPVYGHLNVP